MLPELERADYLVAPNVGRTLQSLRQSVVDTRAAVRWLKQQGYEKIGVVGTSIGSCVGFFAFAHDLTIDAGVFNHVSGYVADVVWAGLSTYHVKEGLQNDVTLDEFRLHKNLSPLADNWVVVNMSLCHSRFRLRLFFSFVHKHFRKWRKSEQSTK